MGSMRRVALLAVLVTVAFAAVGCTTPAKTDPAAVEGSWVVESFGGPKGLVDSAAGVTSDITLKAGKTSGSGGVNSFSGTYTASDDAHISFGPVAATRMAGPPEAMAQETAFFRALENAARFELNSTKLVLADKGNNTLVVLAPRPK